MYPILLEWNGFILPAWHTFYVLGAIGAFLLFRWLCLRHSPQVDSRHLTNMFITCYIAGYFGARLLSIYVEEFQVVGPWETMKALFRLGPMTFYGGAIGGFLACLTYVWLKKLPVGELFDAGMTGGIFALGIGRIGCHLNGDDYGVPVVVTTMDGPPWWAVTFPNLNDGIARVPIQLMEAGVAFVIVLIAIVFYRSLRTATKPGIIGYLVTASYAVSRFFLEYFRADSRGWVVPEEISTSQAASVIVLLAVAATVPFWLRGTTKRSKS